MENDCKKVIIEQNVDPRGWFKVMKNVSDLHNQKSYPGIKYLLPPLTAAKGDIGDISIRTDCNFNERTLYTEASTGFPDRWGNEKLGHW